MGGIRPADRRDLIIGFTSLLAIMAAHALGETARDGLFLAGLRAQMLPWAYLSIAGLALVVVRANAWVLRRSRDKRTLLARTMLGAALVDIALTWWLGQGDVAQGRAFVLYVWTGLFATVTVVQFWLLIDDVVDVGKAKRIFGPIAAGGVLGATLGSLLAERLMYAGFAPHTLIGAAAVCLFFGAMVPLAWPSVEATDGHEADASDSSLRQDLVTLCAHFYLRRLLALVLLSTLALTSIDFMFKSAVDAAYSGQPGGAAAMSQFFARFYFAINSIALFAQFVVSQRLFTKVGVNRALLIMPTLLLLGTGAFALFPALWVVVALKGVDGSLRHSIQRTGMEVLYLPVPRHLRERFKGLIDGVGQRGGQALASLAILGALTLTDDLRFIAAGAFVLVTVWMITVVRLYKPYLELFRRSLQTGDPAESALPLDLRALEDLVASLNSERDEEVIVTLELFERYQRVALIPQLVLYHPSPQVVAKAFELFEGAEDINILPIAHRLLSSSSESIRAIALHAISRRESIPELLQSMSDDESPEVAATALVGLFQLGTDRDTVRQRIASHAENSDCRAICALALAIGRAEAEELRWVLDDLLASSDTKAQAAAATALARLPSVDSLDGLLPLLMRADTRSPARLAIAAMGEEALAPLARHLDDETLPRRIRRHLPRTILRFRSQAALEVLEERLLKEKDGAVRFKILRGMGGLVSRNPRLRIKREMLRTFTHNLIRRVYQFDDWYWQLKGFDDPTATVETTGYELLLFSLREKRLNALERTFRCLQMLKPGENYPLYWRGLQNESESGRAASRELLDHALPAEFHLPLMGLIDDAEPKRRLAEVAAALKIERREFELGELIAHLRADGSTTIKAIADYYEAELEALDDPRPEGRPSLADIAERSFDSFGDMEPTHA